MHTMSRILLSTGVWALVAGCASTSASPGRSLQQGLAESWPRSSSRATLPELADSASVEDLVDYAALSNPGLRAAYERWTAALEKVAPARALPEPRLTYGYYVREVETRVGSQRQRIGVSQTLPWIGTLDLRGRIALEAARAMESRYRAARDALAYRVKKACYELYHLDRAIEVARMNVELLAHLEGVARTRYETGTGRYRALIKAQVELGKLEDRLRGLRDSKRPVVAQLNAALGRPPAAPLPVSGALPEVRLGRSDEELAIQLRAHNPVLQALASEARSAERAVELAGKEFYPNLTLGFDYIDTAEAEATPGMGLPPDSGKDPLVAKVGLSLPIWREKYSAARRGAAARWRAALRQRQEKENELIARLEMALFGRRDAARRIELYRDELLPRAEQSLSVTQQAFAAGETSFLDLIDAQRVRLEFQLAYERARSDGAQRLAEIEMLVGAPAPAPDAAVPVR